MFESNKSKYSIPVRYKTNRLKTRIHDRFQFQDYLFNGLTPAYEIPLMQELFGLRTIVGFTWDELMDMPIQDRRYFLILHNEKIKKQNDEAKGLTSLDTMGDVQKMMDQANEKRSKK